MTGRSLLRQPAVLRQFLAGAERRLESDPEAGWQVAQFHRALGNFEAAARAYQTCAAASPTDPRPVLLADLMAGNLTRRHGGSPTLRPVPFLLRRNLLNERSRAEMWTALEQDRQRFSPSTVYRSDGGEELNSTQRVSLSQGASPAVRGIFLHRLREVLAERGMLRGLGLDRRHMNADARVSVTSHLDGAFFAMHRDSDPSESSASMVRRRLLSFVYYIHRTPARFSGGDLLLFDDTGPGSSAPSLDFTRIVPADNLLICFPPDRLHEVTPVTCRSDDVLDGRLTVNGWLLGADAPARVEESEDEQEKDGGKGCAVESTETPSAD